MATGPLHSISPSMWRDSCLEDFQVALCPLCESYLNVPWYSRAFGSSLPGDLGLMRPVEFSLLWEIFLWNKMSMQAIQVLRGANISYGKQKIWVAAIWRRYEGEFVFEEWCQIHPNPNLLARAGKRKRRGKKVDTSKVRAFWMDGITHWSCGCLSYLVIFSLFSLFDKHALLKMSEVSSKERRQMHFEVSVLAWNDELFLHCPRFVNAVER